MLARPRGGLGHDSGHGRGAAFGDDYAVGSGRVGGAKNSSQVVRIFHAVEHYDQRMSAALRVDHVIKTAVLLRRGDRDYALMRRVAGQAVEFATLQEPNWDAKFAAFLDDALQAQIMALFRQAHPLEGASAGLDGFGNRIETVDVIHGMVSLRLGGSAGERAW